ncbi:hybrid sensor histidine kinase/response regulator [Flavobacterium rhizosphaerae]|uniref:histidine kinase n=1 Tax=Flavobacterium rhizosphaerae TaxID=3163298 RepID=A0ABW8Z0T1_9FLAO
MVQKPKAIKYKVIAGYLLLFITAVVSVLFIYTQILKIAIPSVNNSENSKILRVSNTIARLYASEAVGRNAILTTSSENLERYNLLVDSIGKQIDSLKTDATSSQATKFDSIQLLLKRKKRSIAEIVSYRRQYEKKSRFEIAREKIYSTNDSIRSRVKPIVSSRVHEWDALVNSALSPKQLDSLSKLQVSNDTLAMAFGEVLNTVLIKDNKLKYELYLKEQKLLDENRIISDQLRTILLTIEQEFLTNSYQAINTSQQAISKTVKTMAWVGAITFIFLILFAYIIIRDISINQRYRVRLEELNTENEDLLRSKSMLMATVTHDLQTPLGSILGFYNLLNQSEVNLKQKQYLGNIKESADYILKLVNDLMDFSRLENNKISIEPAAFNVKQLIESVCKTFEPIALNKNIELNWDVDDDLDAPFISDPYRIKQVLTNLIGNALKFTSEGSVEVTAQTMVNTIKISVIDTGIGIAEEQQDAVFREFTQANSGIEKRFGGSGLGLTISKRIIELLGGTITLKSEYEKGSVFTLSIPKTPAPEGALNSEEKNIEVDTDSAFLAGKKILVIDDDAVQLSLMKELLHQYDSAVTTEINTREALSLLQKNSFDAVITDVQMPVMDGFELVKAIRAHQNKIIAQIPVIALSGSKDISGEAYTTAGFTAHHTKPLQLNKLLHEFAEIFNTKAPAINISANNESGALYNLSSLMFFISNDDEALKNILTVFVQSAEDNSLDLKKAAKTGDTEKLSEVAHKMIPMLKQIEARHIAAALSPLEDMSLPYTGKALEDYIEDICIKVAALRQQLINDYNLQVNIV